MRVLCSNVRCSTGKDGDDIWPNRKHLCVDVMRAQQPGIICCQEVLADQFAYLSSRLPEFDSFGTADAPHSLDPVDTIFYRRDLFIRVSAGGHWLSQTPHIPGSSSWNSNCIRLCNWVRLVELATGKEFRVANTHLDHISQLARENQGRLINEDAAAYDPSYPQVLTGDMNCSASNPVIAAFLAAGWSDTYSSIHGIADPGHTFHRFLGPAFPDNEGKIDWIFTRGSMRTLSAAIVKDAVNGRYPSDHYFVSADITLV